MRKLVWFVIILLLIVAGISVACAYSPGIKNTVVNGLTGVGGIVWVSLSTGWSNLATTVGASGTYFLLYTCVALLFGGILFVVLNRAKKAGKIPLMKKSSPTLSGLSGLQREPLEPEQQPSQIRVAQNPVEPIAEKPLEAKAE